MFPFGRQPDVGDPSLDERGPDTVNRLLLHGARYHDRDAVFVTRPEGEETPDWRADRLSIRAALALEEELGVAAGDVVGLWMPLSVTWAIVERALWGLGAVSLALSSAWSRSRVARELSDAGAKLLFAPSAADASLLGIPLVALEEEPEAEVPTMARLLERGGALDTPERATRFRFLARGTPASALASLEPDEGIRLTHEDWAQRVRRFLSLFAPKRGERHALAVERGDLAARVVLYGGWADGLTTVVLGSADSVPPENVRETLFAAGPPGGNDSRPFVSLSDVGGIHG